MEDTTTDLSTKSQPVTLASNGDDVRDDVDTEPHILPATPDSKGTKAENPGSQVTIASPSNEESQPSQDFSVVVVSPDTRRNQRSKRTMPEPKPQPPVKRRRGRPPKNQPKQPKGEAVKEPEISAKQATSQEVEVAQSDMPGLSVMSILEAKIAESYNDSPEHPHQETDFSKPSPPLKSLVSGSSTSVEEEEVSTANTNHKDQVASAMAVDSSTVHPDAAPDSVNAPVKADQNDPDPTLAEGLQQITPNATQTTNETDDIIIQNIASPRALVSKILQIDGRMPNSRTSNAWKEIRCYRNNQDMGSLFDVREAWFLQHRKDD